MFKTVKEFLIEQIHLVLIFGIIVGLFSAIFVPFLLSTDLFDDDNDGCSVSSRPVAPTLLSVTQDPETLIVRAELRDESDNEQWFVLERTLINALNQSVVVGTDIPVPDSTKLDVSEQTGRTVVIDDRGIVPNRRPIPGLQYVYFARAFSCYDRSDRSNDITITSLFPAGQEPE